MCTDHWPKTSIFFFCIRLMNSANVAQCFVHNGYSVYVAPSWNDTDSNVLFSLNSTGFRGISLLLCLCTQIVRPQSEQANARTTAWAWWLNTDRWFLISVRKAFWSRLKAAKPLQVKTFAVSTCTRSEWKWLYWCFRVRVWLLTRARIRDRILAGF